MPQSNPDWLGIRKNLVFPLSLDLGELAVRLGSISAYDRRGDVLFMDGFEDGFAKWAGFVTGVSSAIQLSTVTPKSGAFCLALVVGAAAGDNDRIERDHPLVVDSVCGFEFSVRLSAFMSLIEWRQRTFDGANQTLFTVRLNYTARTLSYRNSLGAFVQFASNVNVETLNTQYHIGKLVVDGPSDRYVRFLYDGTAFSLANIAGQESASGTLAQLRTEIYVEGNGAALSTTRIDDVVVTLNEPV